MHFWCSRGPRIPYPAAKPNPAGHVYGSAFGEGGQAYYYLLCSRATLARRAAHTEESVPLDWSAADLRAVVRGYGSDEDSQFSEPSFDDEVKAEDASECWE